MHAGRQTHRDWMAGGAFMSLRSGVPVPGGEWRQADRGGPEKRADRHSRTGSEVPRGAHEKTPGWRDTQLFSDIL